MVVYRKIRRVARCLHIRPAFATAPTRFIGGAPDKSLHCTPSYMVSNLNSKPPVSDVGEPQIAVISVHQVVAEHRCTCSQRTQG